MSIKLDWEIEAEQPQVYEAGEDPVSRRERRRARMWVLLGILGIIAVFGLIVLAVVLRLRAVEEQTVDVLLDTVEAEVAALRIGDQTSFLDIQRSATDDWREMQRLVFNNYQALKVERNVQLTGRILDATVEGTRARVVVEEIIDGVPYARVWFYWRYDDGWRHVPPDYTFWGDVQTIRHDAFSVRYRTVDEALARSVAEKVEGWLRFACDTLTCAGLQDIAIEIIPDRNLVTTWSPVNDWLLQVPSPLTGQARHDIPFDLNLQLQVANAIAERVVLLAAGGVPPEYPTDAYYLRPAVASWLVGRFTAINTNSFLVASLAENYSEQAVGQLVSVMPPNASAAILTSVTGTASLDQTNLDWRDFFTWRLTLEDQLITRRDEAGFLNLYDPAVHGGAYQRYTAGASGAEWTVVSIMPETGADGGLVLRAITEVRGSDGTRQEAVLFRLVDGNWRRIN